MAWGKRRSNNNEGLYNNRNAPYIPRWSTPPDRNSLDWFKAFAENPRMAVVDRIASDLAFATGKLYSIDNKGDETEITNHPFLDFWQNPNPLHEMSASALWRLQLIYLKIKGEGYFIIERDILGRPAELWPVPTNWVMDVPYLGHPFYTVRIASGTLMPVSVDDMFVMKTLNPLDPYRRGLGKSEAIADEIEIDEYAAKFQKKFFYNDATPGLLVSMPKSTEEQRTRFLSEWKERFRGVFNSHGVAAVNGDASIQKFTENMKDMDMIQGRDFIKRAVLEHFNVPREIMGITESSNRATSEAAQFIYAQNVLMPELRQREDAVNQQLLSWFGERLIWRYDDIIPRNQEFEKTIALEGWNAGLLTKNESRELLGKGPVANGDIFKTQFSDIFIGEREDPTKVSMDMAELQFAALPPHSEDDGTVIPTKRLYRNMEKKSRRVVALQKMLAAARMEQEKRFEVSAMKYFREQQQRISKALGGSEKADGDMWSILDHLKVDVEEETGKAFAIKCVENDALIDKFVNALLDWKSESSLLETVFKPLWKETYDKGTGIAKQAYGMAIDRPELYNFVFKSGAENVQLINKTTEDAIKRSIRNTVTGGIQKGMLREEIASSISQSTGFSIGRSRTIAQTETHTSIMSGNMDMMQKGGITTKTWLTAGDNVVRDRHEKMNGETVPFDETFSNGLMYPGDPNGKAEEVINCRCDVIAGNY